MPNGQITPPTIRMPNIAGAWAQGMRARETRNIAQQQLGMQRQRLGMETVNIASQLEARRIEQATSRIKLSLSLLAGVTDEDSFDRAKEQYLTVIPAPDKAQATAEMDQMFGTRYDPKRIEQGRKQLLIMSGQLDALKPQRPFPVPAGAGVFDPAVGRIVAAQPVRPLKPTGAEREADRLSTLYGLSQEEAFKLSSGQLVTGEDALGNAVLVDKVTREQIPLTPRAAADVVPPPVLPGPEGAAAPPFRVGMEEAVAATGPVSAAKQLINNVVGWTTPGVPFPDTAKARSKVRIFNQQLKTGFINNPRFPVAEQQIVRDFLVDPDRVFVDPDESGESLRNLQSYLLSKKQTNEMLVQRGRISKEQMRNYVDQNNNIDRILTMMITTVAPPPVTPPDILTRDVSDITSEDIEGMSIEQLDALEQRLTK